MDIINKLKKEKKSDSVFDSLIKKKEEKSQPKIPEVEVTPLTPDKAQMAEAKAAEQKEKSVKREFRTEGMHEFDMDSLGTSTTMSTKLEYKARISIAIDENNFEEAIALINELRQKITQG